MEPNKTNVLEKALGSAYRHVEFQSHDHLIRYIFITKIIQKYIQDRNEKKKNTTPYNTTHTTAYITDQQ